uniref:Uncharacterized protein n=1 Tax=Trypanosoma congolense (strain IL3000) TaxID=1068625 RepID=G0UM97_TRYCI|nr:hypothetical protein, unlikely [Trypanosoma congolense IL3000]
MAKRYWDESGSDSGTAERKTAPYLVRLILVPYQDAGRLGPEGKERNRGAYCPKPPGPSGEAGAGSTHPRREDCIGAVERAPFPHLPPRRYPPQTVFLRCRSQSPPLLFHPSFLPSIR